MIRLELYQNGYRGEIYYTKITDYAHQHQLLLISNVNQHRQLPNNNTEIDPKPPTLIQEGYVYLLSGKKYNLSKPTQSRQTSNSTSKNVTKKCPTYQQQDTQEWVNSTEGQEFARMQLNWNVFQQECLL